MKTPTLQLLNANDKPLEFGMENLGEDGEGNEEYVEAARAMVNACFVALQRADEDGICLLLGRKPEGSNVELTGPAQLVILSKE